MAQPTTAANEQLSAFSTYMDRKLKLNKERSMFFFALKNYLNKENWVRSPLLSDEQAAIVQRAREISDAHWIEHPTRAIVQINPSPARPFTLLVEQLGNYVFVDICGYELHEDWSQAVSAHPQVDEVYFEIGAPVTDTTDGLFNRVQIRAAGLYQDGQVYECVLNAIDHVFEKTVLWLAGDSSFNPGVLA